MYLNYEYFKDKIAEFEKDGLKRLPGFYMIEGDLLCKIEINESIKDVSNH